jgi:hypothetical protein
VFLDQAADASFHSLIDAAFEHVRSTVQA